MTEEKKPVETKVPEAGKEQEESIAPEVKEDKEETKVESTELASDSKPESEQAKPEEEIDYKSELQKAQQQLQQAEHVIVETKKENKRLKDSGVDEDIDADIEEKAKEIAEKQTNQFKQDFLKDYLDDQIKSMTTNADEQALIRFHYDSSIVKSGYNREAIRSDLASAHLLANRKKLLNENHELKEALRAKNSIKNSGAGSNQDKPQGEEQLPELTEMEKRIIARRGWTVEEYRKKLKELK